MDVYNTNTYSSPTPGVHPSQRSVSNHSETIIRFREFLDLFDETLDRVDNIGIMQLSKTDYE